MNDKKPMRRIVMLSACISCLGLTGSSSAQPSAPMTVCVQQAPPSAVSYQLIFDGGAPAAQVLTSPADPAKCLTPATHSFTIPAARFTVGSHTVQLRGTNTFGSTDGPVFTVSIGAKPGPATVTAVVPED